MNVFYLCNITTILLIMEKLKKTEANLLRGGFKQIKVAAKGVDEVFNVNCAATFVGEDVTNYNCWCDSCGQQTSEPGTGGTGEVGPGTGGGSAPDPSDPTPSTGD